jgi:hypothetical protein
MKNYILKTIDTYGLFSNKKDFNDKQKEGLINLGFRLTFMDTTWEKYMGNYLTMMLIPSKKYLCFYDSRHFLPCELNENVKDKATLKEVTNS